jgi:hypothetical protein
MVALSLRLTALLGDDASARVNATELQFTSWLNERDETPRTTHMHHHPRANAFVRPFTPLFEHHIEPRPACHVHLLRAPTHPPKNKP